MRRTSLALLLALALPSPASSAAPLEADGNLFFELNGATTKAARVQGLGMAGRRVQPVDVWLVPARNTATFDWVAAAVGGTPAAKSAMIVRTNQRFGIEETVALDHASILEVEIPGAEASAASDDRRYLRVRLQPDKLAFARPGGSAPESPLTAAVDPRLFSLSVDGLEARRVTKVAPFVVRRESGGAAPFALEVTLRNDGLADDWMRWATAELIEGGTARTRNGKLQYFEARPNGKQVALIAVELFEMRLKSFEHGKWRSGLAAPTVTFVLVVERARLRAPAKDKKPKLPPNSPSQPTKKKPPSPK